MIETVSFCGTIYTKTMDIGGFNSLAYTLNHLNTWTPFDIAHAFTNNGTSTLRNTLSGERPTTTKPKQTHSHSSICVLQCAREAQQQAVIACFQTYTQLQIHHIFRIFLANREIHSLTHSLVFGHGIQSHYCSLFRSSHCAMHAFNGILTQCNGDIPLLLLLLLILLLLLLLSHTLKWMYIRNSVFPLFYRRTFTVAFANRLIFRVLLFHRNFSTAIRIECMLNFEPNDPSTFNTPKPREKCSSTHTYTHIHIDGTGNVKETWGERERERVAKQVSMHTQFKWRQIEMYRKEKTVFLHFAIVWCLKLRSQCFRINHSISLLLAALNHQSRCFSKFSLQRKTNLSQSQKFRCTMNFLFIFTTKFLVEC